MNYSQLLYFFFFCFGIHFSLHSQKYTFEIQKINIENGLPSRSVFDITQDLNGYIWTSVQGNICRYDGKKFKIYSSNFLNTKDNVATLIASDKNNNLWFCERSDLDKPIHSGIIDTKKDSIYSFEDFSNGLISSSDIVHISQSKKERSTIFITTRKGIVYQYKDRFEEIYRFPEIVTNYAVCEEAENNTFWISYKQFLLKIKDHKIVESYEIPAGSGYIYRIISKTPSLVLETRTALNEISYWELNKKKLIPYSLSNKSKKPFQLFQKTENYTCFSTEDSIEVIDNSGNHIYNYSITENDGSKFISQTVFVDRQNILWIASVNGLYKLISKRNPFKIIQENKSIRGIYKDDDDLYVGSYEENVKINLKSNKKTAIIEVKNVAATSFLKDKNEKLWVGTSSKLFYQFNSKSNYWKRYLLKERIPLYTSLLNSETGKLWIGTESGLAFLDTKTDKISFLKLPIENTNTEIRHLYQNNKGIWAVSNKGVFLLDATTEKITNHFTAVSGMPNTNLNHLYEDSDGTFWLASKEGGLIHWNLEKNTFKQYTMQNGLTNNTIYAVYPDDYNNLWLPSNYGLMCFNKNTKNVLVYLPKNGIAHEEFNTFAHFKDKDGTLYFGGLNGITYFHPKELIEQTNAEVPLRLSQIQVLNEQNAEFIDITKSFLNTNEITLEPTDRILEIEVSLLDFESPEEHQFSYQIKGYQDQWYYTNSNKITFNNLPYGSYVINIKGKGLASSDSNNTIQIPITVKKPFYLTWQFIVLIIGILAILLFIYIKWRFKKLEKDRNRLEEEVKLRTHQIEKDKEIIISQTESLKALDKAKTLFFSNITHEFRTPLTLIKGPLEQVIENPPPTPILKKRIQGVLKNTNHILELINQLLDLSKLESNGMKVEAVYNDIVVHTSELVNRFQELAKKKEQKLSFISSEKNWKTYFDQEKWDKLVYNLLSNAIKFTPNQGIIQVSLEAVLVENEKTIFLMVKDSGIGIEKAQQPFIFNRFYQADNSLTRTYEGSGIGLALVKELVTLQGGTITLESEVNKGTTFKVYLPVLKSVVVASKLPESKSNESFSTVNNLLEEKAQNLKNTSKIEKLDLLLVEDNEDMREYIKQCLDTSLYTIHEASNGEEGLQKANELIPDLIISDVMMPKMNGFELTKHIRNALITSHIPLILLTAKATLENKLEGLNRGADAYLTKPFSPRELELRVQKLIEIRKTIQKRFLDNNVLKTSKNYQQEDAFIIQLKEFIIKHLDEPNLNGDQIGEHFSISRVHLYRKLKALTDLSVSEYIKNIRLEIGLQLVNEGKLNVSEIADKTGFSSSSLFSKSFKKAYGKSPSQM